MSKVIIAGSRTITDYDAVAYAIEQSKFDVTEVVSGAARGVDSMGERWAREHKISIRRFPAAWNVHGKSAGPIRNAEMARYADKLLLVWDGHSSGSQNMLDTALRYGLEVYEVIL
jgi:predicted Rossmann fold nucleotide-binding protein DprA/Smf involved in DNA uptake